VRSEHVIYWDYEIGSSDYKGFVSRAICNINRGSLLGWL
jgi:hypothetical protein